MTDFEAHMILQEVRDIDDSMYAYSQKYNEALNIALSALRKQVPMKPKTRSSRKEGWTFYICPGCGYVYGEGVLGRYCENCGQAIDLSEYEKNETAKD